MLKEKKTRKRIDKQAALLAIKDFFVEKKGTYQNPIPNSRILRHLFDNNITVRPSDIREYIHEIRVNMVIEKDGLVGFICANNAGYYLTYDIAEKEDYKERLILRQRKEEKVILALGL